MQSSQAHEREPFENEVRATQGSELAVPGWSPIIELRQYTLHPGQRDVLIDLFDSTFVVPLEAAGIKIIGQFRDLDDADKFVWLRGFPTMPDRADSLTAFYDGPVWQAHRNAANKTMVDSDDVLLLRMARPSSMFDLDRDRPSRATTDSTGRGVVEVTILHLAQTSREEEITSFFEVSIAPLVNGAGGSVLGYFVTESSENTFPRLPVREGERVFVSFVGFVDEQARDRAHGGGPHRTEIAARAPGLIRSPQILRLAPTEHSLLDGRSRPCGLLPRGARL